MPLPSAPQKPLIHVIGAGLAGSECAYQLAQMGYPVVLVEMRTEGQPQSLTPAHKTAQFAELVCSNSFGSLSHVSATGQLKWEAEQLNSLIIEAAFLSRVPAGQALSMDREIFARHITEVVRSHPLIRVENRAITSLNEVPRPCVIATGPLTHEPLAFSLREHFGEEFLYFFDAIAPIVATESINTQIAWKADRWDKGTKDYYNCPLNKQDYFSFVEAIQAAQKIEAKDFEKIPACGTPYFDGCMPIEAMLERGIQTLRFGPMKGVGLTDPRTGRFPFAAVQLRQDNKEGTAYNMVGFQTKMSYSDQKKVFRMIPGLEEAEFLKLGSIHRNLYINTPRSLSGDLSSLKDPLLFFAGQITGVEGYFESTCVGLLCAHFLDQKLRAIETDGPPRESAMGSLLAAITDETKVDHFQPTNINFGALPPIGDTEMRERNGGKRWDKNHKRAFQIEDAQQAFTTWLRAKQISLKPLSQVRQAGLALAPRDSTQPSLT
jgi:methylenetetrahydrofolate--tRNA-(uracil-5-)-methyltransferase